MSDPLPDPLPATVLAAVAPAIIDLTQSLAFAANAVPQDEPRARRLHRLRHSTAHLMAEAVCKLFPTAKVATGPAVEHGFFYDFDLPRPLTPEDLAVIEKEMRRGQGKLAPFEVVTLPIADARAQFEAAGQSYKVEVIDKIAATQAPELVTLYRQGGFVDLCAGPHVANTKKLVHFKLLRVSGAYWRGDTTRPMLQRISGTAWETKDDLEAYLHFLEEAKKRNHKKL
ncbi:MAG: threonine--tRNA ligase, partial [Myxococcales bacterium]|nr:threonine--tRNA ligase [Myxococcales bacterium]